MQIPTRTKVIESIAILALALASRLPLLDHPPTYDEAFHLLAANSWAEEGTLRIADGEYPRARLYTVLLGQVFRLLGPDLVVARGFSAILGSLWVLLLFLWLRQGTGRGPAWIASLLFCFAPGSLYLSQFVRFYSLHGVFFFLGAISLFYSSEMKLRPPQRLALVSVSFGFLLLAYHLQLTTLIGIGALSIWAATAKLELWRAWFKTRSSSFAFGLATILLAMLIVAIFTKSFDVLGLMSRYRSSALWAEGSSFKYYHRLFALHYPTLWPLTPVAAVLAIRRNRSYGLFSAVVFGTALLAHSFAGMRMERYIFYSVPFFFSIWGLSLAEAIPWLRRTVASFAESLLGKAQPSKATRLLGGTTLLVSILFVLFANPAILIAVKMISGRPVFDGAGRPAYWSIYKADWEKAVSVLNPIAEEAEILVTTDGMIALYFLGRYDVEVKGTHIPETETGTEWGRDPRSGKRVVTSPEAVELVLECFRTGLFVSDLHDLGNPVMGIGDEAFKKIRDRAQEISMPEDSYLRGFVWTNFDPNLSQECREVRRTVGVGDA